VAVSASILAVLGAVVVAFGVGLVFVPAGVIVAGLELVAAGYIRRYIDLRQQRMEAGRR
jgi:hypothetical protein